MRAIPFHGDGDKQEIYYHINGADWWAEEKNRLAPYLPLGGVVVDVGANIGFMTTLFSRTVGPGGSVHSFEPSATLFQKLSEVIAANKLTNVTAHNYGCGEVAGKMQLRITQSSGNSSLLVREELDSQIREIQEVQIVVLDDYLVSKLSRLDLLKIDTEGFEDRVLAGARRLLRQFRPVVYLELTSEYLQSSTRAVTLLKEEGYRFTPEPVLEECHNGQNFIALPP